MREQQLQDILRNMPAGVATLQGEELRYGFVNEAMQAVLGGPVQEGHAIAEHPGTIPADLLEVMQQVYRSGRPFVAKAYAIPLPPANPGEGPAQRYFDI